ncbi:FecCD family ABC transporter permease [Natronobacterium gregoryi]|uniref:Cobalamin import system permease protein BtuC n=2 Tax=Natronobacterium gregoryi TaxID=44930 RepID=L0AJU9_NATGS|nr:iron ABC transporter permease [Natronobacterium gregoryi]AFZ73462.1 ABC-type Fe3+-siderophore transport system, permease component [Natronobacterium gregoryi SP2]ELY68660.1 ABC transporter integral membrane protein [Natronobacterium gregoryi SP2]PLK20467.1 iron ABC transporter permease [Natronobacterium gregoryi SP2]SFI71393.1 iron complex transport system permease protein [Natronobacterium gregoryi]
MTETRAENGSVGQSSKSTGSLSVDSSLLSVCLGGSAIVILGGLVQLRYGAYSMTFAEAWRALFDSTVLLDYRWLLNFFLGEGLMEALTGYNVEQLPELSTATHIVWNLRLPRVIVAVLVGMNLAISGVIFQAVTRNELASPFILGVSSGAGLLVLLVLTVFTGLTTVLPLVASAGGALAFLIVYVIAWNNGTSPVRLVLAGVIVGTVFGSFQTALFVFTDDIGVVQQAIAWLNGSLTGTNWQHVRIALPWSLVSVGLAYLGSRQLNVLLLGEETASSLGMSVERVRFALSGIAVLAAAVSIAVAGIVSFVGLIVPHMVRNIVGSDNRKLVIGCLFVGPALMISADVGARLALNPVQIPVGIVTGLIGGPYFLYLMRKKQQLGEL